MNTTEIAKEMRALLNELEEQQARLRRSLDSLEGRRHRGRPKGSKNKPKKPTGQIREAPAHVAPPEPPVVAVPDAQAAQK